VDIVATAVEDLRGIVRVLGGLTSGRIKLDRVRRGLGHAPRAASPQPAAA
jgi:hypothetical protein